MDGDASMIAEGDDDAALFLPDREVERLSDEVSRVEAPRAAMADAYFSGPVRNAGWSNGEMAVA